MRDKECIGVIEGYGCMLGGACTLGGARLLFVGFAREGVNSRRAAPEVTLGVQ